MAKLSGKGAVVVAPYRNQFGASSELAQRFFNPLSLGSTRARRMDQVAQKDNAEGLQIV